MCCAIQEAFSDQWFLLERLTARERETGLAKNVMEGIDGQVQDMLVREPTCHPTGQPQKAYLALPLYSPIPSSSVQTSLSLCMQADAEKLPEHYQTRAFQRVSAVIVNRQPHASFHYTLVIAGSLMVCVCPLQEKEKASLPEIGLVKSKTSQWEKKTKKKKKNGPQT